MKKSVSKKECSFTCLNEEFEILKQKTLILFGASSAGKKTYKFLEKQGVEIECFCDNNKDKWREECFGKMIISPEKLKECLNNNEDIIILISSVYEEEIKKQLSEMGAYNVIMYTEFLFVRRVLENDMYKDDSFFGKNVMLDMECQSRNIATRYTIKNEWIQSNDYYGEKDIRLFVHSFQKTGNTTLKVSCNLFDIPAITCDHSKNIFQDVIGKCKDKHIKIITGVRDPLAVQISQLYQAVMHYISFDRRVLQYDGVQVIFDDYFVEGRMKKGNNNYFSRYAENCGWSFDQIEFFDEQIKYCLGIDVYQYPFDKKQGYMIIKKENVELLVYQLEKMNNLSDVIKEFIGAKKFQLVPANRAEDKWYNKYYKVTKKNIQLPRSYVDYYYNSKFMKHFYADEDIQKFYQKWSKQIMEK